MKFCPICKTQYPEDANFCPLESCATPDGPQRLQLLPAQPASRFTPGARLGGGHTGEVFKARDNQTGTDVAYKVVAPEVLPSPAALARAEREFKQLMRVASPKVAAIVDCERTPTGGLAVAMELCQGESLERMLTLGPMAFEKAKSIVAQVGVALLEAQKVGLVHRDVAPKNILVLSSGEVKVINFPLAQPLTDRVAGVPAYLSPEQVQGKPVDQRSNTYSLAAVFYHLLTGEAPFSGGNVQAVLDMHVGSPVLPPTQRRPGAGLPPEADKLILKAMEKSSSRRHLTLRLFLNELEALKEKPAAAVKSAAGEAGLAKTMMLGGNQADVARIIAEAKAAKATAATPLAPAAPTAVAATMPTPASGLPAMPAPPLAKPGEGAGRTIIAGAMASQTTAPGQPALARARTPGSGVLSGTLGPGVFRTSTPGAGVAGGAARSATPGAGVARGAARAATPGGGVVSGTMGQPAAKTPGGGTSSTLGAGQPVTAASPRPAVHGPTPAPYMVTPPPVEKTPAPRALPTAQAQAVAPAATVAPAAQPVASHSAQPEPAAAKAADGSKGATKGGAAFRETLWFKQGDVEQMVAAAKAKMQAAGQPPAQEAAETGSDSRALEDRYADDGSVTVEDRKKFSLRTGSASIAMPAAAANVPGEKMDEKEMVGEISGGRRTLILIIAAVVILALVVVVAMMVKGKGRTVVAPDSVTSKMAAATPPAAPEPGQPAGLLPDAGVVAGAPPGQPAGTGATAGPALGHTGGTTKPGIGGGTGEAKVGAAKKASQSKKKLAAKHGAKHKAHKE